VLTGCTDDHGEAAKAFVEKRPQCPMAAEAGPSGVERDDRKDPPRLQSRKAAALASLAITPSSESTVAGLRILDAGEGLPRLPDLEFAIYEE
jgi:hypothetical protein